MRAGMPLIRGRVVLLPQRLEHCETMCYRSGRHAFPAAADTAGAGQKHYKIQLLADRMRP